MKRTITIFLVSLVIFGGLPSLSARCPFGGIPPVSSPVTQRLEFCFRFDDALLLKDYRENALSLSRLHQLLTDHNMRVDSICVYGAASPEGGEVRNRALSLRRAAAVRSYIYWKYPEFDRSRVLVYPCGENWEGLEALIETDSRFPHRDRVLDVLRSGGTTSMRKSALNRLPGEVSGYLNKEVWPLLRNATACVVYLQASTPQEDIVPADTCKMAVTDTAVVAQPVAVPEQEPVTPLPVAEPSATSDPRQLPEHRPYYWALKTNLAYWLLLMPNLEVEFQLSRRWSLNLEAQVAWWSQGGKHRYYQFVHAAPQLRYHLSPHTPLRGHYLGVYGSGGYYDLKAKTDGIGRQGELWSGGLTYSYVLPLGRSFALEFDLAAGYARTHYRTYSWDGDCYARQGRNAKNWWGPTKVGVLLVWRPGQKGGLR